MGASTASTLGLLLLIIPGAGALANALLGPRLGRRFVNLVGPGVVGAAFVVAIIVLIEVLGASVDKRSTTVELWPWLDLGASNLHVGFDITLDQLSAVMLMVITGVGFLIHVYAVGYMDHDRTPHRFFSYMNLFILSMILLVLAADLVILIIGWALVALSSYLLIGYYYERPSAVLAARKAFITQVIGDVAMYIAAFMIVVRLKVFSLQLPTIFALAHQSYSPGGIYITGICVLLAIGAFAKSAQFPLHTWLPDAMEGPTPVSALIHAATMVTAGVYLIARFSTLFDMAPIAQGMVACVGMGTAVMAGIIALSQLDIKRVIAYSTMSQIGLMIFAVGIGAYSAGIFHFITHALFKALLFLAAGNVIHALADDQDIRLMGGLATRMKATAWCFLVGSLALAGIPPLAGWYSKELLLGLGTTNGPWAPTLFIVGLGVNVLTGLYAFRLYHSVFHGEARTARALGAHESGRVMLVPVGLLALGSTVVGLALYFPIPGFGINVIGGFLNPVFTANGGSLPDEPSTAVAVAALLTGTVASLIGVGFARQWWFLRRPSGDVVASRLPRFTTQLSLNKFYFDEIYDAVLVRPTVALARRVHRVIEPDVMDGWIRGIQDLFGELSLDFRGFQTGFIRDYATLFGFAGVVLVFVMAVLVAR